MALLGREDSLVTEMVLDASKYKLELRDLAKELRALDRLEKDKQVVLKALEAQQNKNAIATKALDDEAKKSVETAKALEEETKKVTVATEQLSKSQQEASKKISVWNRDVKDIFFDNKIVKNLANIEAGFNLMSGAAHAVARSVDGLITRADTLGDLWGRQRISIDQAAYATKGLISRTDLLQIANKASTINANMTADAFARVSGAAVGLAKSIGVDYRDAVSALTLGIGKMQAEELRQYGILIDQTQLYREYAKTHHTTVEAMAQSEKQMAIQDEVLKQLSKSTSAQDFDVKNLSGSWAQLKINVENSKDSLVLLFDAMANGSGVFGLIGKGVSALNKSFAEMAEGLKLLGNAHTVKQVDLQDRMNKLRDDLARLGADEKGRIIGGQQRRIVSTGIMGGFGVGVARDAELAEKERANKAASIAQELEKLKLQFTKNRISEENRLHDEQWTKWAADANKAIEEQAAAANLRSSSKSGNRKNRSGIFERDTGMIENAPLEKMQSFEVDPWGGAAQQFQAWQQEQQVYQQREQALEKQWTAIAKNIKAEKESAEAIERHRFSVAKFSKELKTDALQATAQFTQATIQQGIAALVSGQQSMSAGDLIKNALLTSLAGMAEKKAAFEFAESLAAAATFNYGGAALHFAAGTGFAALAGIATGLQSTPSTSTYSPSYSSNSEQYFGGSGGSNSGSTIAESYKPSFGTEVIDQRPIYVNVYLGDSNDPGAVLLGLKEIEYGIKRAA